MLTPDTSNGKVENVKNVLTVIIVSKDIYKADNKGTRTPHESEGRINCHGRVNITC
jgi:hypothetical protein